MDECSRALAAVGCYDCGCNIFWLKLEHLPVPGVPLTKHGISTAMKQHFQAPKRYIDPIVVAATSRDDGTSLIRKQGNLELVSPPEVVHALILKLAARIDEGAEDEELRRWRQVCLTVTFVFEVLDNSLARYFRSVNLHEQLTGNFEAMARDVTQRVMELMAFKNLMKTEHNMDLNEAELHKRWSEKVTQVDSKFSEKVTFNFVDTAVKVYDRMLKWNELLEIVVEDN